MYHVVVAEVFPCNRPYTHSAIGPCVDLHILVLTVHHMTPKTTRHYVAVSIMSWFQSNVQTIHRMLITMYQCVYCHDFRILPRL